MAQRFSVNLRKLPELRDVDDPLAGFALVEERMRHAHTQGDIPLR